MTSLLPDESYCTSDLGRLLFQSKTEWSGRAYVVDAQEASQLGVKFFEYTCLIVLTPKHSLELDERNFVLRTRFRNLNRLHSQLRKLHQQLYLRSAFPSYPEPKWIGGNDAATVAERRAATEHFLSFLLDQDVLRKARLLHQFVETAEEKAVEGHLVDPSSVLTSGNSLLDNPNTLPSSLVPAIAPDNEDFPFEDVLDIESTSVDMSRFSSGKAFLKEYLGKLKRNQDDDSYLVVAGRLIGAAQLAEAEGAYDVAFHSYKDAASALIKGMESEKSLSNRNTVRLKSAKYLEKAEAIYRNHLRLDSTLFDVGHMIRPESDDVAFRSSNAALRSFRCIGVLPDVEACKRVFLVEERDSGRQYIMKLLEKKGGDEGDRKIFLPTNVPHMVPLVKFFTTQSYVILLLEYVRTGRLWSFLCRFISDAEKRFDSQEKAEAEEEFVEDSSERKRVDNPYRGRHTRFSVSADCDRLAALENDSLLEEGASPIVCAMGEDAAGREEGETARYLLIPADAAEIGASQTVLVEKEEAPAPVSITTSRPHSSSISSTRTQVLDRPHSSSLSAPSTSSCRMGTHSMAAGPSTSSMDADRRGVDDRLLPLPQALSQCRSQLRESMCWNGSLPESLAVHWSAQALSMLYVLHSHGVVVGDLHPDNLLIDSEGNVVFTYQARWQRDNDAEEEPGEREFLAGYAAPECSSSLPLRLSPAADVWSLGALLFELLVGVPLSAAAPHGVGRVSELPLVSAPETNVSLPARDLLSRMLQEDPHERASIDQVRAHPFYSSIDWLLYDNPHGPMRVVRRKEEYKESREDIEERREDKDEETKGEMEEDNEEDSPIEDELKNDNGEERRKESGETPGIEDEAQIRCEEKKETAAAAIDWPREDVQQRKDERVEEEDTVGGDCKLPEVPDTVPGGHEKNAALT